MVCHKLAMGDDSSMNNTKRKVEQHRMESDEDLVAKDTIIAQRWWWGRLDVDEGIGQPTPLLGWKEYKLGDPNL